MKDELEDLIDSLQPVRLESIDPTHRQGLAFCAPERFILYGGAMGGGKSTWLAAYGNELSIRYPGNVGYLCRHELASFRKTTLMTLQELIHWELIKQWHKTENFIRYRNGSLIFYGGLGDDRKAIERLKSLELGWFGIDQAEETTEHFFLMLATRLRLRLPGGLRYKGLLTANPDPGWVKARFVDQGLPEHAFIPALPKDNPHLPGDYIEKLRQLNLPEELLRAWIEGDWDAFSNINTIYPSSEILAAMDRMVPINDEMEEEYGIDVAEYGGDETVIARRIGFRFEILKTWVHKDPMEAIGEYIVLVNYDRNKLVKVDAIGVGAGVYFRLKELGFNVYPIKGSESPSGRMVEKYKNRKTEHYFNFKAMLKYAELPKDEVLRGQLASIRYRVLSNGIIAVETKEEMRRRKVKSPDRAEAIIYAAARVADDDWMGEVYHAGMSELGSEEQEKEKRKRKKGSRLFYEDHILEEDDDESIGKVYDDH